MWLLSDRNKTGKWLLDPLSTEVFVTTGPTCQACGILLRLDGFQELTINPNQFVKVSEWKKLVALTEDTDGYSGGRWEVDLR